MRYLGFCTGFCTTQGYISDIVTVLQLLHELGGMTTPWMGYYAPDDDVAAPRYLSMDSA